MTGARRPDLAFTDAALVNLNRRDHEALEARLDRLSDLGLLRVPRHLIVHERADANECLPRLIRRYSRWDYLFVFADIEAPRQWPWSSVAALRAAGHTSVDLYMLFPLEMGINRLLNYDRAERERFAPRLDAFFGAEDWRAIVERRTTAAQSRECRRELLEFYISRLRTLWRFAGNMVDVRLRRGQGLYKMLFATNHEAGAKISSWAKQRTTSNAEQFGFDLT